MDGSSVQVREDGLVVYRASALGNCTKALVAARLEYEEQRRSTSQMDEGELHENDVLDRMRKKGWGIGNRQGVIVLPITGKIIVRGHIDAEGWINQAEASECVIDVKSQSKDQWNDFEARGWESGFFPHYKWQFSAYMHALNLPGLLVRKNRNSGEVKYEDIPEPFYSIADIRRRILEVEAWAAKGELPEQCDKKMFPCPVFYLHEDNDDRVLVEDETIGKLARQYEDARVAAKTLKGKVEASRRALREALGLRLEDGKVVGEKMKTTTLDGTAITFYNQKNPPGTDWDKVRAALGVSEEEFREQYSRQTESERLKVTLPKGEE